jgi:hypothetical protein
MGDPDACLTKTVSTSVSAIGGLPKRNFSECGDRRIAVYGSKMETSCIPNGSGR